MDGYSRSSHSATRTEIDLAADTLCSPLNHVNSKTAKTGKQGTDPVFWIVVW